MEKVGKDGVITVEEAKTMETSIDYVEGMQFSTAASCRPISPPTATRRPPSSRTPFILIHDKKELSRT